MIIAAFCPTCAEEKARSRDLPPGSRPSAADFVPVAGQDPPEDGTPATCTTCAAGLVFRRVAEGQANGHASSAIRYSAQQHAPGVTTLFAVEPGEEVKSTRELGPDVLVIFTSRRIVKINLRDLLEET